MLRHYVDHLSFRPQNYLKFFVVPLGSNTLSKYLGSIDAKYSMLFGDEWKELLEREGGDASEGAARVSEYVASAGTTLLLPIAEAMVNYRYDIQAVQLIFTYIHYGFSLHNTRLPDSGFAHTVFSIYEMLLGVESREKLKHVFVYF